MMKMIMEDPTGYCFFWTQWTIQMDIYNFEQIKMSSPQLFHIPFHVIFISGIFQETLLIIFKANFLNIKVAAFIFAIYCSHLARPLSC